MSTCEHSNPIIFCEDCYAFLICRQWWIRSLGIWVRSLVNMLYSSRPSERPTEPSRNSFWLLTSAGTFSTIHSIEKNGTSTYFVLLDIFCCSSLKRPVLSLITLVLGVETLLVLNWRIPKTAQVTVNTLFVLPKRRVSMINGTFRVSLSPTLNIILLFWTNAQMRTSLISREDLSPCVVSNQGTDRPTSHSTPSTTWHNNDHRWSTQRRRGCGAQNNPAEHTHTRHKFTSRHHTNFSFANRLITFFFPANFKIKHRVRQSATPSQVSLPCSLFGNPRQLENHQYFCSHHHHGASVLYSSSRPTSRRDYHSSSCRNAGSLLPLQQQQCPIGVSRLRPRILLWIRQRAPSVVVPWQWRIQLSRQAPLHAQWHGRRWIGSYRVLATSRTVLYRK